MLDKLVNRLVLPSQTFGLINCTTGKGCTTTLFIIVSVQPLFDATTNETMKVSGFVYICEGFWMVAIALASPKFQDLPAILPPETIDKSLKIIVWPKQTFVKLKLAKGIGNMVIESFKVSAQPRLEERVIKVTW